MSSVTAGQSGSEFVVKSVPYLSCVQCVSLDRCAVMVSSHMHGDHRHLMGLCAPSVYNSVQFVLPTVGWVSDCGQLNHCGAQLVYQGSSL